MNKDAIRMKMTANEGADGGHIVAYWARRSASLMMIVIGSAVSKEQWK
jgi:hypothetical protein